MKYLTVVLVLSLAAVKGAKILGVFPLPSISHQIVYHALLEELARRGHEVTVLTTNPNPNPPENFTQIDVQEISYAAFSKAMSYANKGTTYKRPVQFYEDVKQINLPIFEMQLQTAQLQEIINNTNIEFDLIFIESFVKAAFAFKHRFKNASIIGISSLSADISNWQAVGMPTHPLIYPEFMRVHMYDLSFWQKLETVYDYFFVQKVDSNMQPVEDKAMRRYFGDDMPSCHLLEMETDMLFVNVNPFVSGIRPLVPAVLYIQGLHLKERKPLPQKLQEYLDASTQGVVYVSFGSNVKSKDLGEKTLKKFMDAFRELPYNFLMKFEGDHLADVPDNMMIQKWLPQQDILGHKNIKAFIFQGGQQSLEEAIRDKIPLICFPIIADQNSNAEKIKKFGIGVKMNIRSFSKTELMNAINKVVKDTSFKENMIKLSNLSQDEPLPPLERAIWWTEYVLRHKGAKHLRSPAVGMSYVEYLMLDIIAALLSFIVIVMIALTYAVRRIVKLIRFASQFKLKKC